jgi:UDP-glucuronate 4-epimerase
MKILVTGGAGFLGSHACERFLADGHSVVALDNFDNYYSPKRKRRNVASLTQNPNFKLAEFDYGDRLAASDLLKAEKFDVVLHLAGQPGVRLSVYDPQKYERGNVSNLMSLLEALREHGPRKLVFASSCSVYGAQSVPLHEDAACMQPLSPHGATKRAAEIFLQTYHALYDFQVTVLRLFTVYGPRQRPEMAISSFARMLYTGETITLYGNGSAARDYTFVSDIVAGMKAAVEKLPAGFAVYNLGSELPISLGDVLQQLEQLSGKQARIERQTLQPGEMEKTCADISRARKDLGYAPSVKFADGLQKTVEWIRQELRLEGVIPG